MADNANGKHASFLDLPPELRNRIYEDVLTSDVIHLTIVRAHFAEEPGDKPPLTSNAARGADVYPALLASCKLIRDEATPILYGVNHFNFFPGVVRDFFDMIGDSKRFIRTVVIGGLGNQRELKAALNSFKDLGQLQSLVIKMRIGDHCKTPESLAKVLMPFMKDLHKARKGTDKKGALDVLQFTECCDREDCEWEEYGLATRALIEEKLK